MFTAEQKRQAAERELKMRRRVYPGRVESGKMTAKLAEHETEIMAAIEDDYRALAEKDRLL